MTQDVGSLNKNIGSGIQILTPILENEFGIGRGEQSAVCVEIQRYIDGQILPAQKRFDVAWENLSGRVPDGEHQSVLSHSKVAAQNLIDLKTSLEGNFPQGSPMSLRDAPYKCASIKTTLDGLVDYLYNCVHATEVCE